MAQALAVSYCRQCVSLGPQAVAREYTPLRSFGEALQRYRINQRMPVVPRVAIMGHKTNFAESSKYPLSSIRISPPDSGDELQASDTVERPGAPTGSFEISPHIQCFMRLKFQEGGQSCPPQNLSKDRIVLSPDWLCKELQLFGIDAYQGLLHEKSEFRGGWAKA